MLSIRAALRTGVLLVAALTFATCDSGGGVGGVGASCSTDNDCKPGLLCVVSVCTPTTTTCSDDADCPGGACVNGSCTGLGSCTSDQDCMPGMFCGSDGFCTTGVRPECITDADCDDGNQDTTDICAAGSCVNTPIDTSCLGDEDCLDGDPCTTDTCTGGNCHYADVPDCCNVDLDCDDDSEFTIDTCVDNACEYSQAPIPCELDADCDDGDACTFDLCEDGTCENNPRADPFCCNTADDCDDGDDTTVDLCVDNACTWTNCTSDIDCEDNNPCSEQGCQEGVCVYTFLETPECACVTDADCAGKGGVCSLLQIGPTSVGTYCVNSAGPKMGGVECTDGAECHSGFCMGLTSGDDLCFQGCVSDTECTTGMSCSSITYGSGTPDELEVPACLPALASCTGDGSCLDGEICQPTGDPDIPNTIITVCAPPSGTGTMTAGQVCAVDTDCQSNFCVGVVGTEQMICWSACASDADCAPGLLCYVNMLYFIFDQGTPDYLSDDTLYSTGGCMPDLGSYVPCVGDADCPVGEFCEPGNNQNATQLEPRCLDSWTPGNGPAGQDCSTDDQCLSGICIGPPSGFCLGLCKNDLGCFGATTCQTFDEFIIDDKNTPDDKTDDVLDAVDLCLP